MISYVICTHKNSMRGERYLCTTVLLLYRSAVHSGIRCLVFSVYFWSLLRSISVAWSRPRQSRTPDGPKSRNIGRIGEKPFTAVLYSVPVYELVRGRCALFSLSFDLSILFFIRDVLLSCYGHTGPMRMVMLALGTLFHSWQIHTKLAFGLAWTQGRSKEQRSQVQYRSTLEICRSPSWSGCCQVQQYWQ